MISDAVKEYVTPLLQAKVDTIILGCTHYPLILPEIRRVAGNGVSILDPAEQIREDVARFLEEEHQHVLPEAAVLSFG